jgi:hypothetical protein
VDNASTMNTEEEKVFVARTKKELGQLYSELKEVYTSPSVLRKQLHRLYELICSLSEYERASPVPDDLVLEADKVMMGVWDELLGVVWGLSSRPNGPFLVSRFILFVLQAHMCQESLQADAPNTPAGRERVDMQIDYIFRLDEHLLMCLRQMWAKSNKTESFRWATAHIEGVRSAYNEAAMAALSPEEFWQVPGIKEARTWVPAPGDAPIYEGPEHARRSVFGLEDHTGRQPIIEMTFYSSGLLDLRDTSFCLVDNDDEETWLHPPALCRSWHFVIDVRQFLHASDVRRRKYLATGAMNQAQIPPEVQAYVQADLEAPARHPYLSRFDFAAAYGPFPPKSLPEQACSVCDQLPPAEADEPNATKARTCPRKSVTIWNLGLRAFHTFHEISSGRIVMCRSGGQCQGHHEDGSWSIETDAALINYIRDFVKQRCGPSATMAAVGLGPTWTPGYEVRCPHKYPRQTYGLDPWRMEVIEPTEGGLCGLVPTMMHQTCLGIACPAQPSRSEHYCCTSKSEKDKWMLARSEAERERVAADLKKVHHHGFCFFPEYCQAIVGQMGREDEAAVPESAWSYALLYGSEAESEFELSDEEGDSDEE